MLEKEQVEQTFENRLSEIMSLEGVESAFVAQTPNGEWCWKILSSGISAETKQQLQKLGGDIPLDIDETGPFSAGL